MLKNLRNQRKVKSPAASDETNPAKGVSCVECWVGCLGFQALPDVEKAWEYACVSCLALCLLQSTGS